MDAYVDLFQAAGRQPGHARQGQPLAGRAPTACKKHGGFYLGSIGGPAARLAKDCIKKVEVLEYPELGMEAVWKIEVVDFPAFIVVDDKGNDFFAGITGSGDGKLKDNRLSCRRRALTCSSGPDAISPRVSRSWRLHCVERIADCRPGDFGLFSRPS